MDWWSCGRILAGRDLEAGGTWLGISREGRIGLLTNVREPQATQVGLASRGHIVPRWLDPAAQPRTLHAELAQTPRNGYNLLAFDIAQGHAHWASNRHGPAPVDLEPGIHGLSNAALNTPWPKLQRLTQSLTECLQQATSGPEALINGLLDRLTDRHQPDDEALPRTGVPMDWERILGRVFIESPDGRYGTRCSTVVVVERLGRHRWRLWAVEQNWDPRGLATHRSAHRWEGLFAAPDQLDN